MRRIDRILTVTAIPAFVICAHSMPAYAQSGSSGGGSASSQIKITGTSTASCSMSSPRATATENTTFAQNAINISDFIDATTATLKRSRTVLVYPSVTCNYNAKLSVVSANGGLKVADGGPDAVSGSGTILKKVPYTVDASWGSVVLPTLDLTNGSPNASSVVDTGGANRADLTVTIMTQDGADPLIVGRFEDTITLKVGATP